MTPYIEISFLNHIYFYETVLNLYFISKYALTFETKKIH